MVIASHSFRYLAFKGRRGDGDPLAAAAVAHVNL
jgi:hypothetical protein